MREADQLIQAVGQIDLIEETLRKIRKL